MKFPFSAALYIALGLGAIAPAWAQTLGDVPLEGDMRKLTVHASPRDVPTVTFTDPEGDDHALAQFQGAPAIVNFWATWCAPCREEMPALDALSKDGVQVVTIASGRNTVEGIEEFFADEGIETLPLYLDPQMGVARSMAVLGLPVTVLLNADGQEVARLTGGAEWDAPEARAVIDALGD